jgi:hypothetical protein
MKKEHLFHFSEAAADCLTCACENRENLSGQSLLLKTRSLTAVGVLAAVLVDESPEHLEILHSARTAIREQRDWCMANGPFRRHCAITRHLQEAANDAS